MLSLRVYGILINEKNELLVSDEFIRGGYYTKFPGGGLEYGEGTRDCLKREFMEEMELKVEVGKHLYTTDFFQVSAFDTTKQIVSIYYYAKALEDIRCPLRTAPFQFDEAQLKMYETRNEIETFRFIPMTTLKEEDVTLPIDKLVVRMLLEKSAFSSAKR